MEKIYIDYNATTPIAPEVAKTMRPYLEQYFGNPSSTHSFGITTKKAIEKSRKQIAELINAYPDEIVFTSGGSESNNYAIKGTAYALRHLGKHIIISAIEHPAVTEVCKFLEGEGFEISVVPVDEYGMVNPENVESLIREDTILISIMHANNEVGTIQPIEEIGKIARRHKIRFHCDAAQSIGKIKVDVKEMNVDLLSVAGHKFYAPKGIGALYIRRGITLQKLIHGADHERNHRAGTENILEIVGLGEASILAKKNLDANIKHYKEMRDYLEELFRKSSLDFVINGHPEKRLPNTLSISFKNCEANTILTELEDVAASAGAACHSDEITVSHVLTAMNVSLEYAMGTIRFSTGKYLTKKNILKVAEDTIKVVSQIQKSGEVCELISDSKEIKLTHYTFGMGCACKIEPQLLESIIKDIPILQNENVLVGVESSDDAAIYKIDDETAIIVSVDFFTPIVDDAYEFGKVTCANAMSDIYAMGAKPLFALNIVAFPTTRLPMNVLQQILLGASDKAKEVNVPIIGGHSIDDTEPKFGLVVVGIVNPKKIWKNYGAKPGDVLILTKPLGTGILSTAQKRGLLEKEYLAEFVNNMTFLNAKAYESAKNLNIHACTDITGFGLLGHLHEMTKASNVIAEVNINNIKFLNQAYELALSDVIPGGTKANKRFTDSFTTYNDDVSEIHRLLINDAQTSGGLLFSLPEADANILIENLEKNKISNYSIVGKITANGNGEIFVK